MRLLVSTLSMLVSTFLGLPSSNAIFALATLVFVAPPSNIFQLKFKPAFNPSEVISRAPKGFTRFSFSVLLKPYEVLKFKEGKYVGDCEDYALSILYRLL